MGFGKIPWRRAWQLTLDVLPGESQGQRSLAGYSPWGRKDSDMTEATYHAPMHALVRYIKQIYTMVLSQRELTISLGKR